MTDTLAFPDAVGYGDTTVGGRGGAVVIVTNLNDDGPGSLRWALEDVKGPRTVVFEVAGAIELKTQILIRDPFVTIAGQSAPGDGITIEGARIRVKADEVIVRGVHFRPGDAEGGQDAGDRDGLFIGTTDFEINNVVVDHNTFTWAVDENLTVNGHVRDISLTNNIIAQGLSDSIHPKGEHSKGLLISNWEGAADWASNISVVGNLFAGNEQRNPEVRSGQNVEIVNNFIYDYGLGRAAIAVGGGNNGTLTTSVFIVGNVMMAGPDTSNATAPIAVSAMGAGSAIYIADNLWQTRGAAAPVDQTTTAFAWDAGGLSYVTNQAGGSGLHVLPATAVIASVLQNAGASPADRDAVDERIIELVRTGGAAIVDSVAQAGGYAQPVIATAAPDFDRDGMPDWFESLYGFDSRTFNANGDQDRDGYTNLEEYLNGLITGFDLPLSSALLTTNALAGVADVLKLTPLDAQAPLHFTGSNGAEGDWIDITALLSAIPEAAASISNYIDIRTIDGKTVVFFDADGAGTSQQSRIIAVADSLVRVAGAAHLPVDPTPVGPLPGGPREQVGSDVADRLRGDAGVDHLFGGAGNDVLDGGAGADRMVGGLNDDTYIVDHERDAVVENADEGVDTVSSSVSLVLGANIENLGLTGSVALDGTGNELNNKIVGNAAANILTGLAGDDALSGGAGDDALSGGDGNDKLDGGLGADSMDGGAGDDVYIVDNAGDAIVERSANGLDSVSASVSFTLSAYVENLTLTSLADLDGSGNGLDNKIVGNGGANTLYGLAGDDNLTAGAGDDSLYGGDGKDKLDGGVGVDVMDGGAGDDLYIVDDIADVVIEQAGGGVDSVNTSASYALGNAVENLSLTGVFAINGTGNDLANKLTGNDGDNHLIGLAGADDLRGGAGRDTLDGGADNDKLDGGKGADRLIGGLGDDIYFIDDLGDEAVEVRNEGTDSVSSSITWTLGDNFEHLTLSGLESLAGNGNAQGNRITGNAGANTLSGLGGDDSLIGGAGDDCLIGGAGADTLTGGAGADRFVFGAGDSSVTGARLDCIMDYERGLDRIAIIGLAGDDMAASAVSIAGNAYRTALAAADVALAAGEQAVYVSGSIDAWLFWDDPATAQTVDGAVQIKNGGYLPMPSSLGPTGLQHPATDILIEAHV